MQFIRFPPATDQISYRTARALLLFDIIFGLIVVITTECTGYIDKVAKWLVESSMTEFEQFHCSVLREVSNESFVSLRMYSVRPCVYSCCVDDTSVALAAYNFKSQLPYNVVRE